jgi:hypothetical protein
MILVLGMGMSFLAQSNLEVAANLRSNTETRYRAEAGIDHAMAALRFNEGLNNWGIDAISNTALGTPPTNPVLSFSVAGQKGSYTVTITPIAYATCSSGSTPQSQLPVIPIQVRVTSTGSGGGGAAYDASAVVSRASTINCATSTPPASTPFPINGLLTDGAIGFQNAVSFYNASAWGRGGFQGNSIQNGAVSGTVVNAQGQATTTTIPGGQPSTPPAGASQFLSVGTSPTQCTPSWVCNPALRTTQTVPKRTYREVLDREMVAAGLLSSSALASNQSILWYNDQLRSYCNNKWVRLPPDDPWPSLDPSYARPRRMH